MGAYKCPIFYSPARGGVGNSEKCTPLIIVVFRFEGEMVQCVRQYEADLQNMVEIQKKQVYFKLQLQSLSLKGVNERW